MKDVSILNEMIFSASTENELQEKFKDIYHRINNESEYDDSGSVEFLPLPRLNSHSERSEVQDIISVVIESGFFTSGPYIGKVEETLRLFYGAHTCIATSSGTDALKIALKSVGVEPGDEVIVPLNSFAATENAVMNRPGFPGECFICELRLPDHRFRWKHNKLFLLLPEEYGPAFPAIVDCYTSPPT